MNDPENETKSSTGCDDKVRGYYRNPYINYYVRLFDQKEFKGKPAREVAKYAGQSWRNMQETEKQAYRDMTKLAKKGGKRSKVTKLSKSIRRKPGIRIALRIKQEQRDQNINEETAGTSSTEQTEPDTNSGRYVTASDTSEQGQPPANSNECNAECVGESEQSYEKTRTNNESETCEDAESHSSSEVLIDNAEAATAAATCDAIQPEGGTDTTWHSDCEDTSVCHDFRPLPPTPIPSECTHRVCITPRRGGKRGGEEESPPPAPKRSKTRDQERTAPDTSPAEMATPKRTRINDIHTLSTLKKTSKSKEREGTLKKTSKSKEREGKGKKKREKKQSVKRKLSFSSDSESVYSFEPRSKRKRITKTNQSDDESPQNRNNAKRKYAKAKARKRGDKSNMKRKKQGGWYLNSSEETDSE